MQSTSWEMPDWMKHKLHSRLLGEISIPSDKQMTPPLVVEGEEKLESLDVTERVEWKIWLKTKPSENQNYGIWSHHFMANRWGNSGNSGWLYFSECWILSQLFHSSLSRLFSSSLSAIRVVSSAYLRLLIFLLAILIAVCASIQPSISHDVLCI